MPRKKKQVSNEKLPANKQKGKKVCTCCHQEKKLTDFYLSYSPMYSLDNRVPICKECCKHSALNDDGSINYPKFKELLRNINKPLFYDHLFASTQSVKKENSFISDEEVYLHGSEIISKYFTLCAMRQDRNLSYSDSEAENFIHTNSNRTVSELKNIRQTYDELFRCNTDIDDSSFASNLMFASNKSSYDIEQSIIKRDEEFNVTEDIIRLFGEGYTKNEYRKMYNKYEALKLNYTLQTSLHQEALATYVRFKVKEEDATARGEVAEAKKWYDAAQSAAENGKLTPKQLSQSDLQGGINNFSDIFKAVEQAVDVIPILPQFKYRPNDAIDFIIWCYINYARDLRGLPQCSYEEVYEFYDRKKKEYISQYGDPNHIFDDDPSDGLRDNIKQFITLPSDYDELGGNNEL